MEFFENPISLSFKKLFCTNNFTLHGNESSTAIFDMFEEGIFFSISMWERNCAFIIQRICIIFVFSAL